MAGGVLVLIVGTPGSGKSTFARRLALALGAELVQTDGVRKQLFAEPRYTGGEHAAVYGWCHNLIRSRLGAARAVVFDATNLEERNRRRLYEIADACGARLVIAWTSCPPGTVQERLLRRQDLRDEDDQSDATWGIYLQMRRRAEAIHRPHLVVNTTTDLEALVRRVAAASGLPES